MRYEIASFHLRLLNPRFGAQSVRREEAWQRERKINRLLSSSSLSSLSSSSGSPGASEERMHGPGSRIPIGANFGYTADPNLATDLIIHAQSMGWKRRIKIRPERSGGSVL